MTDSFSIPSHGTSSFPSAIMQSSESMHAPQSTSLLFQPQVQPLPRHQSMTAIRNSTEGRNSYVVQNNNMYQHMFDQRAQSNINNFRAAVKHTNKMFNNYAQCTLPDNHDNTNTSTNNNSHKSRLNNNTNNTNNNNNNNNNNNTSVNNATNNRGNHSIDCNSNNNKNDNNNHILHDFSCVQSNVSSHNSGESTNNLTHRSNESNEASSFSASVVAAEARKGGGGAMQQNNSNSSFTSVQRFSAAQKIRIEKNKRIMAQWYPLFHIAAPGGWLGVPSGLCFFKGYYHVFYQYNPFDENWGLMHWGHAISEDLVHWRQCTIALVPGNEYDHDGCFSGTAVVHEQKMYIFYTGHRWISADSADDIYQQQCLAVSDDGIHFSKLGVIVRPPPGYSHFRDPRVWFEGGMWWMVCGARSATNDLGQLIMYSSKSLTEWDDSKFAVLLKSQDKNVFMWECPDFFPLGGKHILMFSPQGMHPYGYERRNRFHSGYIVGEWAPFMHFTPAQPFAQLDRGHDFYAPQTFLTPDGRRMLIGWLDMWGNPRPSKAHNWSGVLTLPRQLILDTHTNKIKMRVPRQLQLLRRAHAAIPPQTLAENVQLALVQDCTMYEIQVTFNVQTSTSDKYGLWLGNGMELFVDAQSNRLMLNRHFPQHMLSGYRSCALASRALLKLHIFIDRTSIEVFVNDGDETFTSRIYPQPHDHTLRLFSLNGTAVIVEGNVWLLQNSIE